MYIVFKPRGWYACHYIAVVWWYFLCYDCTKVGNIRDPLGVRAYPWIVNKKVCIWLWVLIGKDGVYALCSVLTFYATKSLNNYGSCSTPDSSHLCVPNSSWVDFFEKVFIHVKENFIFWSDIKVGNDSFRHTQFGPKASQTISQRRFLPKVKVCDSYRLGVRNNSFHQPQFNPNSSWVDFVEKAFIYVKERLFLKW